MLPRSLCRNRAWRNPNNPWSGGNPEPSEPLPRVGYHHPDAPPALSQLPRKWGGEEPTMPWLIFFGVFAAVVVNPVALRPDPEEVADACWES